MAIAASPPLCVERFARIIDDLCRAVAARGAGGRLTSALLMLLWGRLRRTALRVRRVAARIATGAPVRARRPPPPRAARPPPPRLPRGRAWLVRLAPGMAVFGSQLQHLLSDPQMAALAQAPPMRRLLGPLCQMLGVTPPPIQRPAVTQAPPPPAAETAPPHPSPANPPLAAPGGPDAPVASVPALRTA